MTGRVIVITGATSGIGYEVAKYLAEGGNDIVLACRDADKGEEAMLSIKQAFPNSLVQYMLVDLASSTSIRNFVTEFTKKKRKLSVLINNAAIALNPKDLTRQTTNEGFEVTMATNYLGHFLLTNLLLEYMIQTASFLGDGRIINVTCGEHNHEIHRSTKNLSYLDVDNFQLQKDGTYNGLQAYKNSKLCSVLMTYSLADKLKSTKVSVNAVDPGFVPLTKLYRHRSKVQQTFSSCCVHKVMGPCIHSTKSIREAALHVCNLAASEKYERKRRNRQQEI